MKVADGYVSLELVRTGDSEDDPGKSYLRWRDRSNGTQDTVYVHQLSAIAAGYDPYKVFSNGEYETHHKDDLPENNARENLELLRKEDHSRITIEKINGTE